MEVHPPVPDPEELLELISLVSNAPHELIPSSLLTTVAVLLDEEVAEAPLSLIDMTVGFVTAVAVLTERPPGLLLSEWAETLVPADDVWNNGVEAALLKLVHSIRIIQQGGAANGTSNASQQGRDDPEQEASGPGAEGEQAQPGRGDEE